MKHIQKQYPGWEVITDSNAAVLVGDIMAWFKSDPIWLDKHLEVSCINSACISNCGGMRIAKGYWSYHTLFSLRRIIARRCGTRKRMVLFRKSKVYIPRRLPLNPHYSAPLPLP